MLPRLANGLANFHTTMGTDMKHVTVTIMTEFGRRVGENASLGTDHGRGSVHMVMGGGIKSQVISKWEGLASSLLEFPGDVPVQFDYRQVLLPVLQRLEPNVDRKRLFPGYEGATLPLFG
jgi:uncharacterized protein (DUF1501 family)